MNHLMEIHSYLHSPVNIHNISDWSPAFSSFFYFFKRIDATCQYKNSTTIFGLRKSPVSPPGNALSICDIEENYSICTRQNIKDKFFVCVSVCVRSIIEHVLPSSYKGPQITNYNYTLQI